MEEELIDLIRRKDFYKAINEMEKHNPRIIAVLLARAEGRTLRSIATEIGRSPERVRQMEYKARRILLYRLRQYNPRLDTTNIKIICNGFRNKKES